LNGLRNSSECPRIRSVRRRKLLAQDGLDLGDGGALAARKIVGNVPDSDHR
jgi:hypothetical protein